MGLCYICRIEPRDEGFKSCLPCRADSTVSSRVYRQTVPRSEEAKKRVKAGDRARYERAKAAGICTMCRRRPADRGLRSCAPCREMHKVVALKSHHKRRQAAIDRGDCQSCWKRPRTDGYASCEECRTYARNNMTRQRRARGVPEYGPRIIP